MRVIDFEMFFLSLSYILCLILYLQQVPEVEVVTAGNNEGAMSIEMKGRGNDENVNHPEGDNNGNDEKTDEGKDDNDNTGEECKDPAENSGGANSGGESSCRIFTPSPIPMISRIEQFQRSKFFIKIAHISIRQGIYFCSVPVFSFFFLTLISM